MRANGEINAACGLGVVTGMAHPEKNAVYVVLVFLHGLFVKNATPA